MKVEIFDTALRDRPGTCYFDLKKEIEHLQEKYEIKDIKTIMKYPHGFDVMVAIFYEEPYVVGVKEFNWIYSDEDIKRFISSHDVTKVENLAGSITVVTYRKSVNNDN